MRPGSAECAPVGKEPSVRHLESSMITRAPIERAFRLAVDPAYLREQMPWIRELHDIRGRGDRVGDGYRFHDTMLGLHPTGRTEVRAADPPRLVTVVTTYDNGIVVDWTTRFTPALEGTEIENEIDYSVPGTAVGRMLDGLVLHRLIEQRLRTAAERYLEMADAEPRPAGV